MKNLLDDLELEVQVPSNGYFILNRSTLGGTDLLAPSDGTVLGWQPMLCAATSVNVKRGGTRDGVTTTIDVGTLNASFRNSGDPTSDPNIKPNAPVRLRRAVPGVGGIIESNNFESTLGGWTSGTFGSVSATNAGPAHSGTKVLLGFGISGDGTVANPWAGRAVKTVTGLIAGRNYRFNIWSRTFGSASTYAIGVTGLGSSTPKNTSATLWIFHEYTFAATATSHQLYLDFYSVGGTNAGYWDDFTFELLDVPIDTDIIFTGNLSGARVTYEKTTDDTNASLSAVDAVQALANTPRFGAANPYAEYESWQSRAERVLQSSPVPWVAPTPLTEIFNITPASSGEATNWTRTWTIGTRDGQTVMVPSFATLNTSRTMTGLVPGRVYTVYVKAYATLGENVVITISTGDTVTRPGYSVLAYYPIRFAATSASHTLTVGMVTGGSPEIAQWSLESYWEIIQAANVVYESNLVNHLDLAVNTGRSGWFVDRLGVVRFAEAGSAVAHFSDVHNALDPLHMCYTDAEVSYDWNSVVNQLVLANHARKDDPDHPGEYLADDANLGPYVNLNSQADYGTRGVSLETSIYTGAGFESAPSVFAASVLDDYAAAEILVTRLTFKGTDNAVLTAALDIYDVITVDYRDVSQTSVIVGIEHQITTEEWLVTLDIMEMNN